MDRSKPGLPVHHHLQEFTQTHIHWVSDTIQPSHPLSSPSLPAFNLSQHQGLFQWVSSSNQVAKVLELQLQHQSFQINTQDWSPLGWTGWISLQSKGLSRVFSNTTVHSAFFFFFNYYYYFYCIGFCHTLKWNSHGFTCGTHPDPPSHLPLHPLPLGFPSAPGPSACLMHPTWAGDLFHPG